MAKSRPSGAISHGLMLHDSGPLTGEKNGMRLSSEEYSRIVALREDIQHHAITASFNKKPIHNTSSGFDINITNKSIHKATSGIRRPEELEALRRLPSMLKRAVYKGPDPDKKNHPGVLQFHLFESDRKIFGKRHTFILKIKEFPNGKFWFFVGL